MKPILWVALCTLNSKYIHSSLAPWYLLSGIENYCKPGIIAEVIEGTINEDLESVARRILANRPQVIGFSCYIWNIEATKQLVRLVKDKLPEAVIVLGGPEVSYNAADILQEEPLVQYVVSGEGEEPLAMLLNCLYHNAVTRHIPGVNSRAGDELISATPYVTANDPPSPYTEKYFNALKSRIAYLETSRGCPYSCAFCLSGFGQVRYFSLERAKKELLMLANSGTQTVKLVDRTFNANRSRAVELISFILEHYGNRIPEGVCFHFEIAGDILDEAILGLLAAAPAGLFQVEIGMQSFNEKTLTAIRRKTNVERLKNNIRQIVANGNIHVHLDLIAGLPHEDLSSFAASFNTAYDLKPNMLQLGFLKLLHGSQMREEPENYPCRFNKRAPYEVLETPWLSHEELRYLKRTEDALERLYNSGRFRRTLAYLLERLNIKPFELFAQFGEYLAAKGADRISLNDFIALVLVYFSSQPGIDKTALRDMLVCDYLATNSSGRLPVVLQVKDPALKATKQQLKRVDATFPQHRGRRGIALLYAEPSIVYAYYQDPNPVTGEYPLIKIAKEALGL
ncbi:coproporphyrinogen III oxidase [Sporotomaculum syntrophicum]|uniref:Coproporphyrinogen III oxidase n=1 Tax=Sporotomaculum syntrophicum TaxID=182264 RepID=A0A9D3AYD4_9FIRM|nr:radical SAM protein [Sporotomaculum syntrophicum]KAF1085316.1 coproporphyrinogen III oxidase [Sporotomaculum syntrophicum]